MKYELDNMPWAPEMVEENESPRTGPTVREQMSGIDQDAQIKELMSIIA